jgi:serine protease Do
MKTSRLASSQKISLVMAMATICLGRSQFATADVQTYQKTLVSTTWVLAKTNGETSSGAGVLVDSEKKLMMTNAHVVGEARTAVIFFPDITDGNPKVERKHYLDNVKKLGIRGRILAVDRKRDLALVELDRIPEGITAISLAAASIGPGEEVQSIGNPGSTDALWVFTSGTVRSVYQKSFSTGGGEHDFKVVETQAPINSGDSGGPVVNSQGELVAISQAISPKARLISYSVDISEVKAFLEGPWKPAPVPVSEVLEKAELTFESHETGHLEVSFEQKDKSSQSVFISKDTEYYERADIRRVWSLAATLKKSPSVEVMTSLLQQNAQTKIGGWTVEKTAQGEFLVIYCAKLDATSAPQAVKSTMEYVAQLTSLSKKSIAPQEHAEKASETLDSWLGK